MSFNVILEVKDKSDASLGLWYVHFYVASSFQAAFIVVACDIIFYITMEHGVSLNLMVIGWFNTTQMDQIALVYAVVFQSLVFSKCMRTSKTPSFLCHISILV